MGKKKVKKKLLRKLQDEIYEIEIDPNCSPYPNRKEMDYGYRCALLNIRRIIEHKLDKL